MVKAHIVLTKPGIILGNVITTAAGFVLASKGSIDYWLFLMTLIGLSFIIASSCVFNNYIDRQVDAKMARTKNRPLATGTISCTNAVIFGALLGLIGAWVLFSYTNLLTLSIALAGFLIYVFPYSFGKYHTSYGTLIGSVAGAAPPLVGYCAVTNSFDLGALLLFLIVVLWQMPHFYAIAIYRFNDYARAGIPVLPVKKGMYVTKVHMVLYTIAFLIAALLLTVMGYTGYIYFVVAALLGLAWLVLCIQGFKTTNDARWARKVFLFSLIVITGLSVMMAVDVVS
jgi:protoheme IX farnesyltransferase